MNQVITEEGEKLISTETSACYKISAEDKNIAQGLDDVVQRLGDVIKELEKQEIAGFPFQSEVAKKAARDFCISNVRAELQAVILVRAVIRSKQILKEVDFDEAAFHDMHTLSPWLSHVQKLHGEHMQGIHAHLQQLVANEANREKEINRVFEENLKCRIHSLPAIGRSLDGKSVICKDCK